MLTNTREPIRIWSLQGKLENEIELNDLKWSKVRYHNDKIIAGTTEGSIVIFKYPNELVDKQRIHSSDVTVIDISKISKNIMSIAGCTLKILDESLKPISVFNVEKGCEGKFLTPDRLVLYNREGYVIIVSLQGEIISRWKAHRTAVTDLNVDDGSNSIYTASTDGSIKKWSFEGKLLKSYLGHKGWVVKIALSSDASILYSIGFDKDIRIWNMNTGISRDIGIPEFLKDFYRRMWNW